MIVEERTYHVITGKLPEVVSMYEQEGIALQQEYLGNLARLVHGRRRRALLGGQPLGLREYAEREERRGRLQADERWKSFLARLQPLLHTQWNRIMVPTSFSPIR